MARTASKDVVNLTKEDFAPRKFKVAPAGKYKLKITKAEVIKGDNHNYVRVTMRVIHPKHKMVFVVENLFAHVGWKIAQLLHALGIKKTRFTLQELCKLIVGKTLRAQLRVGKYNDQKRNEIVTFLSAKASDDEETNEPDEDDDDDSDADDDEDDTNDADDDDDSDDDEEDDSDDDDSDDDDDSEDEDEEDDDDDDDDEDEEDDDEVDEDDEEEEDEEEEEKPKRGRKPAAKKTAAKRAPAKKTAAKKTAAKRTRRR